MSSRSRIRSNTSTSHHRSLVEQVEIGVDAPDFPTALRAALRQAPDVIVVGEMRDAETMRIALAAAETGHLVLSTVHTTDVASTVSRVADSFPAERQNTIRQEMAMALAAVMTQTLLPRIGGGVVPAAELLMVGYGARQHIRRNALQHLNQEITITAAHGSFTLEESLARLVKDGLVEWRDAHARAAHLEEFEKLVPPLPSLKRPCPPGGTDDASPPHGKLCVSHYQEDQMRVLRRSLAVCLAVLLMAPAANAQKPRHQQVGARQGRAAARQFRTGGS